MIYLCWKNEENKGAKSSSFIRSQEFISKSEKNTEAYYSDTWKKDPEEAA